LIPQLRVELIPEAVAHEVDGDDGEGDGHARGDGQTRVGRGALPLRRSTCPRFAIGRLLPRHSRRNPLPFAGVAATLWLFSARRAEARGPAMRQLPTVSSGLESAEWLTEPEREAILRFKDGLTALPGAAVERMILFGSRARGEGDEGSDLDLAVILAGEEGPYWRAIVDVATELNLEYEYRIRLSPLILSRAKLVELWDRERGIAHAILVEGIEV
jgi:predicted nucleotidyltransferase